MGSMSWRGLICSVASGLKVGDYVRLRTGGPDMVVVSIVITPTGAELFACALVEASHTEPIMVLPRRLRLMN
ncbi:hypothetical protein SAMN02745157_4454 [Kaistia soli DSM 19436]|uniref:Uncharacterized protein n=1 Tax=Kaistia soli DSM 19436 TaxID=1122133 RepID=A0A1M5L0D7_9HYPH|nr:hypothetical protein SAMN02745157_4454 [Kaistia soli DSM 19436]